MARRRLAWPLIALVLAACAQRGTPVEAPPESVLLDHPTGELPAQFSQTGLYLDLRRNVPSARAIPYHIRYPLYSDDNDKSRYLFLPPGSKIDNSDPQQWRFPVGTLLFKTFYLTASGGRNLPLRKIETRVLQHRHQGWQVGVYQWNAEGSEAYLSDGNDISFPFALPLGNYVYTIPGQLACRACHQPQPNFVIGFEAIRLSEAPAASPQQQLNALREKGIFLYPERVLPAEIPGSETEKEALGYLHGNCAHCHNPASPVFFTTNLDLRHGHARESTINVAPQKFAGGDSSILRVKPGHPELSLLFQLMAHTFPDTTMFMPPLGISLVDTAGLRLIKKWIEML